MKSEKPTSQRGLFSNCGPVDEVRNAREPIASSRGDHCVNVAVEGALKLGRSPLVGPARNPFFSNIERRYSTR